MQKSKIINGVVLFFKAASRVEITPSVIFILAAVAQLCLHASVFFYSQASSKTLGKGGGFCLFIPPFFSFWTNLPKPPKIFCKGQSYAVSLTEH